MRGEQDQIGRTAMQHGFEIPAFEPLAGCDEQRGGADPAAIAHQGGQHDHPVWRDRAPRDEAVGTAEALWIVVQALRLCAEMALLGIVSIVGDEAGGCLVQTDEQRLGW